MHNLSIEWKYPRANRWNFIGYFNHTINGRRVLKLELNEVSTFKPQPRVIFRYVDDLFCVFHDEDELEQFLLKLISFMLKYNLQKN